MGNSVEAYYTLCGVVKIHFEIDSALRRYNQSRVSKWRQRLQAQVRTLSKQQVSNLEDLLNIDFNLSPYQPTVIPSAHHSRPRCRDSLLHLLDYRPDQRIPIDPIKTAMIASRAAIMIVKSESETVIAIVLQCINLAPTAIALLLETTAATVVMIKMIAMLLALLPHLFVHRQTCTEGSTIEGLHLVNSLFVRTRRPRLLLPKMTCIVLHPNNIVAKMITSRTIMAIGKVAEVVMRVKVQVEVAIVVAMVQDWPQNANSSRGTVNPLQN